MSTQDVNRISGHVVLGLSLFAMALVVGATVLAMLGWFSPSPDDDEGTAAHLFQLAIVLLLPTGLMFLYLYLELQGEWHACGVYRSLH